MEQLKERRKEILKDLVSEYIKTGEPVGSARMVNKFHFDISPATVRNEMAALERMGYIYQPHISAGRVPTSKGYRFFIENVVKKQKNPVNKIDLSAHGKISELQDLLDRVSRLISYHTKEISLVLSPNLSNEQIKYIHFFTIDSQSVYTVLVTNVRAPEAVPIIRTNVSPDKLARLEQFINAKLSGLPLRKALSLLKKEHFFSNELKENLDIVKALYKFLQDEIKNNEARKIYIEGIANLLSMRISLAEERVRSLLRVLEEKRLIENIVKDVPMKDNLGYLIGEENKLPQLKECSIITVGYKMREMQGRLALIGPTRMDYVKGIYILESIAESLEEIAYKITL